MYYQMFSQRTKPTGRRGRDTRRRVLDVAESRASAGGPLNLSGIAREAGVSRGTVYRHFGGEDGLREVLAAERGVRTSGGAARERILDAVASLIAERGLRGATFEAVARAAGTGQTTVYRLFGDRRGLVTAFVNERTPKRLVSRLTLGEKDGELARDLFEVARELLTFMRDHRELIPLALDPDPETAELFVDIRRSSGSTRAALAAYLERQVRAGRLRGDPRLMAEAFFGMAFGLGLGGEQRLESDLDGLARFAVRTLLEGHAAEPGTGEDAR